MPKALIQLTLLTINSFLFGRYNTTWLMDATINRTHMFTNNMWSFIKFLYIHQDYWLWPVGPSLWLLSTGFNVCIYTCMCVSHTHCICSWGSCVIWGLGQWMGVVYKKNTHSSRNYSIVLYMYTCMCVSHTHCICSWGSCVIWGLGQWMGVVYK